MKARANALSVCVHDVRLGEFCQGCFDEYTQNEPVKANGWPICSRCGRGNGRSATVRHGSVSKCAPVCHWCMRFAISDDPHPNHRWPAAHDLSIYGGRRIDLDAVAGGTR